jgi:hypothetical protein
MIKKFFFINFFMCVPVEAVVIKNCTSYLLHVWDVGSLAKSGGKHRSVGPHKTIELKNVTKLKICPQTLKVERPHRQELYCDNLDDTQIINIQAENNGTDTIKLSRIITGIEF